MRQSAAKPLMRKVQRPVERRRASARNGDAPSGSLIWSELYGDIEKNYLY